VRSGPTLLFALPLLCGGCGVDLEHGLDERQANQIVSVLDSAGIAAEKRADDTQSGAYKIVVTRAEAARSFRVLEAQDLPKAHDKGLGESFSASSLLPSATEERARLAAAQAVELERTLESLPAVQVARVHLALPAEELLPGDTARVRPTASVLLRTRGTQAVAVADVQRLVAGAIPALQTADVNVLVTGGPADQAPTLEPFGPLRVARESRSTLATLAASGLALIALLALGLTFAAYRLAVARRALHDADRS
jgi:type III secretion protein J